ncbi:MAG: ABC transporter ATP-binding protein [Immundisolibacteraceae bacterium]|nr:ABC transporter ATP-binding protein [Immundisolibacteraceae bacterium]
MIELTNISRHFSMGDQTVKALDGVSLTINSGEYISLMGPSGSGKSSLLNLIGLLDTANAGRYLFDGQDTTNMEDRKLADLRGRYIGFVFQSFHLIPRLSAADNVMMPMTLAGIDIDQRRQRVAQLLERFGLTDRAGHKPNELSGGQRQRVAIARAMVMQPSLILADEPTGNLDQNSGKEVVEQLEALNQDGITLVVVTHDSNLGQRAHRQINLVDGRIVADSGLTEPTEPSAELVSSSPPNPNGAGDHVLA